MRTWASRAGIVANKPDRDRTGWDYFFEFRRASETPSMPLDLVSPELSCRVQVKSTAVGAQREQIALSHWERMVKDALPWFFLRAVLSEDGEIDRLYVIHVGEVWIERVFRRLRETPRDAMEMIHKRTLDLTWDEGDAVPSPSAMRERIAEHVGDPAKYPFWKAGIRDSVGYDGVRQMIRFTSPATSKSAHLRRLVDLAIGLVDSVPISSLIVRDVRFGIPEIVREARDVDASVSIPNLPSAGKTRLTISNADRTRSVSLDCETYVPTLILPKLPKRFFKARLVSSLATIVLNKGSFQFSWHFPEESASLTDWATAAKLYRMMHEQRHARLIISYESKGNVVEVTLFVGSRGGRNAKDSGLMA